VSDEWARRVCLVEQGPLTCRYLVASEFGWACAKLTSFRQYFDRRVADGTMKAKGDNCPGYPQE
jgi:hypothetical protein